MNAVPRDVNCQRWVKEVKDQKPDSSDSEVVAVTSVPHLKLLDPIQKYTFEMEKMPKQLHVENTYMWLGKEKKNVYIVRSVEGTTPLFYQCIDLEGQNLLAAQNELSLYQPSKRRRSEEWRFQS